MRRRYVTILAGLWLAGNAQAAQFYSLRVSHDAGRYQVSADVYLAAPLPAVYQVLTDYNHLTRITGAIRQSRVVRHVDAHTVIVFVETRACVLFFCHSIRQTQRVTELPPRYIIAKTIAAESNVKSGRASWHLDQDGNGTRMHWQMTLTPDFWVPPLIGPALVEGELRAQGKYTAEGVEKLARERAYLPPLRTTGKHDRFPQLR